MSKLHLTDGGWVDPYSKAVSDLLFFINERFPTHDSWVKVQNEILSLEGPFKGAFRESLELVHMRLYELMESISDLKVPQRDLALARIRFTRMEQLASLFSGAAGEVQMALEEAYLDATMDERTHMLLLADLRDTVFETNARERSLKDFVEQLRTLVNSRKERGWPAWRQLEHHCDLIETFIGSSVRA